VLGDLLRVYVLHTKTVANAWTAQRAAAGSLAEATAAAAAEQGAVDAATAVLNEAKEREATANPPAEEGEEGGEEEADE
jgi:hypothetical protein